jgi:hypothetical protein
LLSKVYLKVNISGKKSQKINIFVQLFDSESLVSSLRYNLVDGKNSIDIPQFHNNIKYMKILFRVESSIKTISIYISRLDICVEKKREEKDKINLDNINLIPNIKQIQLENKRLLHEGEHTYYIKDDKVGFYFYLNYKKGKKIIIALPGATDRNKKFYNFQRHTWSASLECSFMSVLDPTVTKENELSIGWFQGKKDNYALDSFISILKSLLVRNNIKESDIVFFGSSAGGFVSLHLANHFTKSTIVAINPQIYLYNYAQNPYKNLLNYSYSGMSHNEVKDKYRDRLEINIDFSKRDAPIYYYQNISNKHHLQKHLKHYLEGINSFDYVSVNHNEVITENKKLYILYYDDPENGNSPPNKEKTLEFINDALNRKICKGYKWQY